MTFPAMRWIVRPDDGSTVRDVLVRAGADAQAVASGRVFVGPRRVRGDGEAVRAGDVVTVAPAQQGQDAPARIVLHAGDLVAADKPAGIPTIPDHAGASHALVAAVARALGVDAARLHPTSRLDRDVSGVVFFALTKAAAALLAEARTAGTYERRYVAIAARSPAPASGSWTAPVGRARDPRLRAVGGRDPVAARTQYALAAQAPGGHAMLGVAPVTGRTHQIRVHAAHAGLPLLGDRAYGGPTRVTLPSGRVLEPRRIALHCARVVVPSGSGEPLVAVSEQPPELAALWSALGGNAAAWEGATSCVLS
jgi:23S rRNA pseudouridine1911/1915/1917 synthase